MARAFFLPLAFTTLLLAWQVWNSRRCATTFARFRQRTYSPRYRMLGGLVRLSIVAGLGALPMVSSAKAETLPANHLAGFTCPGNGATARTTQGAEIRFEGAVPDDPTACVWAVTTASGKQLTVHVLYNLFRLGDDARLNDHMRHVYRDLFPLSDGKKVSQLISGSDFKTTMRLDLAVEGPVSVKVGSVTHTAWLIHAKATGTFGSDITMDNRYWLDTVSYAPIKKIESVNGNSDAYDVIELNSSPTNQLKHGSGAKTDTTPLRHSAATGQSTG